MNATTPPPPTHTHTHTIHSTHTINTRNTIYTHLSTPINPIHHHPSSTPATKQQRRVGEINHTMGSGSENGGSHGGRVHRCPSLDRLPLGGFGEKTMHIYDEEEVDDDEEDDDDDVNTTAADWI